MIILKISLKNYATYSLLYCVIGTRKLLDFNNSVPIIRNQNTKT